MDTAKEDFMIHISKPGPRPPKQVQKTAVQPPKRQFRQSEDRPAEEVPIPPDAMEAEDLDGDSETVEPPATKTKRVHDSVPPASDILRARGWKVHDLGGAGDCGYRSLAVAIAHNKGKQIDETEAARDGARIRYQAVSHLRKHLNDYKAFILPDWYQSWIPNPPSWSIDWGVSLGLG